MGNLVNLKTVYPHPGMHWYNIVVDTSDEKYEVLAYARMHNIVFHVSGYFDKFMIELYMNEEQRAKADKWINANIGGAK